MIKLKRTKINDREVFEDILYVTEQEWKVLEPQILKKDTEFDKKGRVNGIKLEVLSMNAVPGDQEMFPEKDDKEELDEYEVQRVKAEALFKDGKFGDALILFNSAAKLKDSVYLKGRIKKCVAEIKKAETKAKSKK